MNNQKNQNFIYYRVALNAWEVNHSFDINSIMFNYNRDATGSTINFSGELVSPYIPNIQKAEIELIEDTEEYIPGFDDLGKNRRTIFGSIKIHKKSSTINFTVFIPPALFHRIALLLDSHKFKFFVARGKGIKYGSAYLQDFDLNPIIKYFPDIKQKIIITDDKLQIRKASNN
jgi:hypothetical protein